VFEPFWRKDEERVGSGLGLSIAAQILRLHGGEIGCRDTPGGGATFVMALPVAVASSGLPGQAQARSA
jgi:two-component system OmpR family sensor kinase